MKYTSDDVETNFAMTEAVVHLAFLSKDEAESRVRCLRLVGLNEVRLVTVFSSFFLFSIYTEEHCTAFCRAGTELGCELRL